jgi:hypothetical protein
MRICLLLLLAFMAPGCSRENTPVLPGPGSGGFGGVAQTRTWLALGDSYTIGCWINERIVVRF